MLTRIGLTALKSTCRSVHLTFGPLHSRQKIPYKDRYHWLLDLNKSRKRAQYPWIPREPDTTVSVNGQELSPPEMRLEFIVPPELDQCKLKPYVSWRAKPVSEPELTPERLFDKKYIPFIQQAYDQGESVQEIRDKITPQLKEESDKS